MSDVAELRSKITELIVRVDMLEKECRHFERQFQVLIHHHEHVDGLVQQHESTLFRMRSGNN